MDCHFCERRCNLEEGKQGFCRMYEVRDGVQRERFPFLWSVYDLAHIESMPFYHVYPGSRSFSVGTEGCNFACAYCMNSYIAREDPEEIRKTSFEMRPKEFVRMAQKLGCHNIVFNINEPTVSLLTLQEISWEAKRAGMPMGCLSNGYQTPEGVELMTEIFSFVNISMKGLKDSFAQKTLGIPGFGPVLRNIGLFAQRVHLEVTTPIVEHENDDEIQQMADFLASVNKEIPWHVFRLQPDYKMIDSDYPNVEHINAELDISRKKLPYIYFHNFIGSEWVSTHCPYCGELVVERISLGCGGDTLDRCHLNGRSCPKCGHVLNFLGEEKCWTEKEKFI